MGEIADAMIDGECCELCGQYFAEDHGYPVVCKGCWSELDKEERQAHQRAIFNLY